MKKLVLKKETIKSLATKTSVRAGVSGTCLPTQNSVCCILDK